MKTLNLPEPAAQLWLATRDVICSLGPPREPWRPYLGGGTILAARWFHRQSTDIDIIIRDTNNLTVLMQNDEHNVVMRLNGETMYESTNQIKIRKETGIIDLNTAPVQPKNGAERVKLAGRNQHVLSTAQILRGKFERAARPGPVRDAYDIIRASQTDEDPGDLTAAYSLVRDENKQEIEATWAKCDARYEREAEEYLRLTEETCVDLRRIGSTAAETVIGHRLERVVIELHGNIVTTERTTKNGKTFPEESHAQTTHALYSKNGVEEMLAATGIQSRHVIQRIAVCRSKNLNGVIYDSADPRPLERFTGQNTSMKRHKTPLQI